VRKPILFMLLAGIGILLGSISAMYSGSVGAWFLMDHDSFVSTYLEAPGVAELNASPSPGPSLSPSPSPTSSLLPNRAPAEQAAETLYSQRGVVLPLAAMDVIISLLLLFGCLRALRGDAWGLSAWSIACLVTIPYELLNAVVLMHQSHELPLHLLLAWAINSLYCVTCLLYLRRPSIRALVR
jgi:hypothetical protein